MTDKVYINDSTNPLSSISVSAHPNWIEEILKLSTMSLKDQLLQEAENEEKIANGLKGCSFFGAPPWLASERKASLLRQAAAQLKEPKTKKKKTT